MTQQTPGAVVPRLVLVASIVGLWTLAVTQPLLDLLGRNAAFLVAHDATSLDVIVMVIFLALGVPLLLAGMVLLVRAVSAPAALWLHAAVVAVEVAVLALVVLQVSGAGVRVPAWLSLVGAVTAGTAFAAVFTASAALRVAVAITALVAPLVAAMFVFASPARAVVFPAPAAADSADVPADAPPVVMVLFDELPVASLLDRDGAVLAEVFPNFARLADDATFLRNATGVHGQTSDAVPAILTGRYPRADTLPVAADHPDNLFTLLAGRYRLHVEEPLTELCPIGRCGSDARPVLDRYTDLFTDLLVVAGHVVLPADLARSLPSLEHGWRDFRDAAAASGKEEAVKYRFREARLGSPVPAFEEFVAEIDRENDPVLHFIHVLVPHSPWRYLEDGTPYAGTEPPAGLDRGRWGPDPWLAAQGYQRHVVQTQLADRLLGTLLDRLEAEGLYDESLILVMADHGASFTPETSLRVISEQTVDEIARVPVLIKTPGQDGADVDDSPIETVDVLPTLLDVIGAQTPDGLAGHSVVGEDAAVRTARRFFGPVGELTITEDQADIRDIVERNLSWFSEFGPQPFAYRLAPPGRGALLGQPVPAGADPGELTWSVGGSGCADVEAGDGVTVPALLCATLDTPPASTAGMDLAIAIDGRIVAVTRSTVAGDGSHTFRALLGPEARGRDLDGLQVYTLAAG